MCRHFTHTQSLFKLYLCLVLMFNILCLELTTVIVTLLEGETGPNWPLNDLDTTYRLTKMSYKLLQVGVYTHVNKDGIDAPAALCFAHTYHFSQTHTHTHRWLFSIRRLWLLLYSCHFFCCEKKTLRTDRGLVSTWHTHKHKTQTQTHTVKQHILYVVCSPVKLKSLSHTRSAHTDR